MRPILFRGRKKNGVWVFGVPFIDASDDNICHIIDYANHETNTYHWHEVDVNTISQYIGIEDIDGVKVFEGDEVTFHRFYFDGNGEAEQFRKGIVEVIEENACFVIASKSEWGEYDNHYFIIDTSHNEEPCIKVIGSIYDLSITSNDNSKDNKHSA